MNTMVNSTNNSFVCPICGYDKLSEPPYDENGYPSYEICSCCGFEYGFTDSSEKITFDEYRNNWIKNGFEFKWKEDKPLNWNEELMLKQLENIKLVNYEPRI